MKLRFFTIPVHGGDEAAEELNRFLASHRVVTVDREFVANGSNSAWSVCVTVQGGEPSRPGERQRERVDYREILSKEDFVVYSKLRDLRKGLAEKEGVPAYALFTNEQLADMVRTRVSSRTRLGELDGVGAARVEKYGDAFLEIIRSESAGIDPSNDPKQTDEKKPSEP